MTKKQIIEFELDCLKEDRELTIKHLNDLNAAIEKREKEAKK